jgi:hypothetical protein
VLNASLDLDTFGRANRHHNIVQLMPPGKQRSEALYWRMGSRDPAHIGRRQSPFGAVKCFVRNRCSPACWQMGSSSASGPMTTGS